MQFLKILQPFIHKNNVWVYIEYFMQKKPLSSSPNTKM